MKDKEPTTLKHTIEHVVDEIPKWPGTLYRAEEIGEKIGIGVERLKELADARYCPHFRVDGGEPLFKLNEIKDWCAKNMLYKCEGKQLPFQLRVFVEKEIAEPVQPPKCIRNNTNLIEVDFYNYPPGVYFLCKSGKVVYVGQSVNVLSRIYEHTKGKDFDHVYMIPVPESELDSVEGAFIRHLKPQLNGRYKSGAIQAPCENEERPDNVYLLKYGNWKEK